MNSGLMVRSRSLFIKKPGTLLAMFYLFAIPACASAACSFGQDHAEVLQQRIDSADKLIADGTRVEQRTGILLDQFKQLRPYSAERKLAENASIDVYSLYESLFKQYEDALNQYKQHRKEYFEHAQQYHQMQQPQSIEGANSQEPDSQDDANVSGVLRFKAQDKCSQLQQLEGRIIRNEANLEQMVSDLQTSMQKESQAMFASSWGAANQLAIQNSNLAGQYNHLGMLKTSKYAENVHNLIAEANRDGSYGSHMQAYKDLNNGNTMEGEIHRRCQAHIQFANSALNDLASMRPAGMSLVAPKPDERVFTANDIQRESSELDSEYANVQELFAKLESVRKSMPPTLKKDKGITN